MSASQRARRARLLKDVRIRKMKKTPLWLDAAIIAVSLQLLFAVFLMYTGWPSQGYHWLRFYENWQIWAIFILPAFLLIYFPSRFSGGHRRITFWSMSTVAFILILLATPRISYN